MQEVPRRMVDVHEHGVMAVRSVGPEARASGNHGKEVSVDQVASLIRGEFMAHWEQPTLMPFDDFAQDLDDLQGPHPGVSQDGVCCIAEAEPSDHNIEICTRGAGERDVGERDLTCSEEA